MDDKLIAHKKSMEIILSRIVKNNHELEKLLEMLYYSENIFPIKAILSKIDTLEILKLNDSEKRILNDLTAMYI